VHGHRVGRTRLKDRDVEHRRGVGPQIAVLHVRDDTDDFGGRFVFADRDGLAERILPRPEHPGHPIVDDHDGPGRPVVALAELAPAQQRNLQRAEICGTDEVGVDLDLLAGRRVDHRLPLPGEPERHDLRQRHALRSGDLAHAIERVAPEALQPGAVVAGRPRIDGDQDQIVGPEPRVHRGQAS
jgi:hypothetical protein